MKKRNELKKLIDDISNILGIEVEELGFGKFKQES